MVMLDMTLFVDMLRANESNGTRVVRDNAFWSKESHQEGHCLDVVIQYYAHAGIEADAYVYISIIPYASVKAGIYTLASLRGGFRVLHTEYLKKHAITCDRCSSYT